MSGYVTDANGVKDCVEVNGDQSPKQNDLSSVLLSSQNSASAFEILLMAQYVRYCFFNMLFRSSRGLF